MADPVIIGDCTLYQGDCLEILPTFPDACIDLTVTSPPYDNLRTYNGYLSAFKFEPMAQELYRVTKPGGVVVWVVGDATINGSETGNSFRQALYFMECGFRLHDTMIWIKEQLAFPNKNRYYNGFEYMFVFSIGNPKTFHQIKDKKNRAFGRVVDNSGERKSDGTIRKNRACAGQLYGEYGARWNYWMIYNQSRGEHSKHPATFPEALARDHILSWSNPGDTVLDCMMGSGTTGKMATQNGRKFIGCEIVPEYFEIAVKRIEKAQEAIRMEI